MHAHHEILVKAQDIRGAEAAVDTALKGYGNGIVWDWYTIGGRWSGWHTEIAGGKSGVTDMTAPLQHTDEDRDDNYLCYADNPTLFKTCIEIQLEAQRKELQWLLEQITDEQMTQLATRDLKIAHDIQHIRGESGTPQSWMLGYYLYHIGKLTAGIYDSGSYFYNAPWGGPEMPQEMWSEIEANPSEWWLVTVDLHN